MAERFRWPGPNLDDIKFIDNALKELPASLSDLDSKCNATLVSAPEMIMLSCNGAHR
jgi:hypothetical protein